MADYRSSLPWSNITIVIDIASLASFPQRQLSYVPKLNLFAGQGANIIILYDESDLLTVPLQSDYAARVGMSPFADSASSTMYRSRQMSFAHFDFPTMLRKIPLLMTNRRADVYGPMYYAGVEDSAIATAAAAGYGIVDMNRPLKDIVITIEQRRR